MSVGEPHLDSDHRALIALINRLHDQLEWGEPRASLDDVFESLIAYIAHHFAREEDVMAAAGAPAQDKHKGEHQSFSQDMRYIRDRYINGGDGGIGTELLDFLKNWLNHHILIQDMAYKPYVQDNPRASDAARRFGSGLSDKT